jgi:hypothetical protein
MDAALPIGPASATAAACAFCGDGGETPPLRKNASGSSHRHSILVSLQTRSPAGESLVRRCDAKIDGDKATLRVIKDGFKQQPTAVAVVGDIAWVAEAKLALRDDANNRDPGPWLVVPVPLR